MKWTIVGFFLTISYKSVLRGMLMSVYYEDTIDTIDDMLASEKNFMVPNATAFVVLLTSDPRMKYKELAEKSHFFKFGTGQENGTVMNSTL